MGAIKQVSEEMLTAAYWKIVITNEQPDAEKLDKEYHISGINRMEDLILG